MARLDRENHRKLNYSFRAFSEVKFESCQVPTLGIKTRWKWLSQNIQKRARNSRISFFGSGFIAWNTFSFLGIEFGTSCICIQHQSHPFFLSFFLSSFCRWVLKASSTSKTEEKQQLEHSTKSSDFLMRHSFLFLRLQAQRNFGQEYQTLSPGGFSPCLFPSRLSFQTDRLILC